MTLGRLRFFDEMRRRCWKRRWDWHSDHDRCQKSEIIAYMLGSSVISNERGDCRKGHWEGGWSFSGARKFLGKNATTLFWSFWRLWIWRFAAENHYSKTTRRGWPSNAYGEGSTEGEGMVIIEQQNYYEKLSQTDSTSSLLSKVLTQRKPSLVILKIRI